MPNETKNENANSTTSGSANGIKDSGTRQEFQTGAVRDGQKNKGRFDLIPFWPTLAYAAIMEAGAEKYAANNWRKGMPISRYINSAQRHLEKYKCGMRDEPHLWQALWNVACAIHTQIQIYLGFYPQEFNDLYSDFISPDQPVELLGDFEKERVEEFAKSIPKK